MSPVRFGFAFVLSSFLALTTFAQSPPPTSGTPPFGSFAGGPDTVNLASLNVDYQIPVIHRAGRGLPFDVDLSYNSSVWYKGASTWGPAIGWGLAPVAPMGFVTYDEIDSVCAGGHNPLTIFKNWAYVDPSGTSHPFPNITTHNASISPCNTTTSKTSTTADGSGYTMSVTGNLVNYVTSRSGTTINPSDVIINGTQVFYSMLAGTVQDRNGNKTIYDCVN